MPDLRSRRVLVPRSRRLTCDVLHFHRRVPICPHDRRFRLEDVERLRKGASPRISWPVLMLKGYALVACEFPVLRQAWLGAWPPTVYEHPESVAMLAIEREYRGVPWVFWGKFRAPDSTSLLDLQTRLDHYKQAPVETVFRRQLQLSGVPNPLRRWLWWWNLNVSGRARARRTGTFFLTTLAGLGAEIQNPPSFHTGNLSYGPLDERGEMRVTLSYDHRLLDGATVARALARLEEILRELLAAELESLGTPPPAFCPAGAA